MQWITILKRIPDKKSIWSVRLSDFNEAIAHNTFAPTTFVTMDKTNWSLQETKQFLDETRKTLKLTGNYYPNSDVD